jgi:hypothetical protein
LLLGKDVDYLTPLIHCKFTLYFSSFTALLRASTISVKLLYFHDLVQVFRAARQAGADECI